MKLAYSLYWKSPAQLPLKLRRRDGVEGIGGARRPAVAGIEEDDRGHALLGPGRACGGHSPNDAVRADEIRQTVAVDIKEADTAIVVRGAGPAIETGSRLRSSTATRGCPPSRSRCSERTRCLCRRNRASHRGHRR